MITEVNRRQCEPRTRTRMGSKQEDPRAMRMQAMQRPHRLDGRVKRTAQFSSTRRQEPTQTHLIEVPSGEDVVRSIELLRLRQRARVPARVLLVLEVELAVRKVLRCGHAEKRQCQRGAVRGHATG